MKYRIDIVRTEDRRGYFAHVLLPYVDGKERGERIVHKTPSFVSPTLAWRYANHWIGAAPAPRLLQLGGR